MKVKDFHYLIFRLFRGQAVLLCLFAIACAACTKSKPVHSVSRPSFSGDTAYMHIYNQVAMGPRVPDTKAHTECLLYLMRELERYGAVVEIQKGTKTAYDGREQLVVNIIGHFGKPSAGGRVLLAAHYDSRPWCDEEEDYEMRFQPVPAANDGASGVGVLLEAARHLGSRYDSAHNYKGKPVDIVFFDCEDMGTPAFFTGQEREDTWCLGSQLWAESVKSNPQWQKTFQYGILLDMVGAYDAVFPKEYTSVQYAGNYVEKIWHTAAALGHGKYFSQQQTYPITDDHTYVNEIAGIPCVDIIHYDRLSGTGFPAWWHTTKDDMRNISIETLQAVGETVLSVIEN